MRRVALTGGIATGKSYVRGCFQAAGIPTIDADSLAREAVARGTPGAAAVRKRFGDAVMRPDGSVDRPTLGALIFSDPEARRDLEAIVHPEVYRAIAWWFAGLPRATPFAVADIPLLFETGHERDFDSVVVAACDPAEQVRRVMRRDALTEDAARARLAAQWPIEEKVRRATHVIRTDGTHEDTDAQVRALVSTLGRAD